MRSPCGPNNVSTSTGSDPAAPNQCGVRVLNSATSPAFMTKSCSLSRSRSGRRLELDAIVVAPRLHARAELLVPLGLQPAELRQGGHLLATYIEADAAGAVINYDLILEDTLNPRPAPLVVFR